MYCVFPFRMCDVHKPTLDKRPFGFPFDRKIELSTNDFYKLRQVIEICSNLYYKWHNQFQNIPHYILGSDPQKWAKLGEKMFKHTSNILFTQSKFVPC